MQASVSSCFALVVGWNLWWIILIAPLVRTPLPYTPNILPSNFTYYTTYYISDATASYSAFDYSEIGHVIKTEHNEYGQTRNDSFPYHHEQSFSGVSCSYNLYATVTGYDSDGTPQGDDSLGLEAPACAALVAFRGLLIVLIILPFLTGFLVASDESLKLADEENSKYQALFVVIGGGNWRGEGQEPHPDEPPSPSPSPSLSRSSSRRSAAASEGYSYTIEMAEPQTPSQSPRAPAAIYYSPPVHNGAPLHAYAQPAPLQQPPPIPPRPRQYPSRARGARPYLSINNREPAAHHLRQEGAALREALRTSAFGLAMAVLGIGLAVGTLVSMMAFVLDSGLPQPVEWDWGTWCHLVFISIYIFCALIETLWVVIPLVVSVRRYLVKDGAGWHSLM